MADATLVPSYEDNYPTVVLESLACHTRVVAYRTGGIPEMGEEPYVSLVEKGDREGLLREARAVKSFDWTMDAMKMDKVGAAQTMLAIYRSLLPEGQGKV